MGLQKTFIKTAVVCCLIFGFSAQGGEAKAYDNTVCQVMTTSWDLNDFNSLPQKAEGFNKTSKRFCTELIFIKVPGQGDIEIKMTGPLHFSNAEDGNCSGNTSHPLCTDEYNFILDASAHGHKVIIDASGLADDRCALRTSGNKQLWKGFFVRTKQPNLVGTSEADNAVICNEGEDNDFSGVEREGVSGGNCGNNIKEDSEECDDGNLVDGDGCSSLCTDTDRDDDGVDDSIDNCSPPIDAAHPEEYSNPDQADCDDDNKGDKCDNDWDNDGVADGIDNCAPDRSVCSDGQPHKAELEQSSNPLVDQGGTWKQPNQDEDALGDLCDPDKDGDDILEDGDGSGTKGDNPCKNGHTTDCDDNCPNVKNPTQENLDNDDLGTACDPDEGSDTDGDGVSDPVDNCPTVPNGPAQAAEPGVGNQDNHDGDTEGDACDPDDDNDGMSDAAEKIGCTTPMPLDPINPDSDGDGSKDGMDTCPCDPNPSCGTVTPPDPTVDVDGDGVINTEDNCPTISNPLQENSDDDAIGDACDLDNPDADPDGDGILTKDDNCPAVTNPGQENEDEDSMGDPCDGEPSVNNDVSEEEGGGEKCSLSYASKVTSGGWIFFLLVLAGMTALRFAADFSGEDKRS